MAKKKIEVPVDKGGGDGSAEDRIAALEERLAAAEAEAAAAREEMLRRAADLENARKRLTREHERRCAAAARSVIERLLPVLADLTRAIDAADADDAVPQHYVDAIRMLDRKIYDVLKAEGLEVVAVARGDPFDPEVHEAVITSCDATLEANTVVTALEPAYKFQGVLLKPAKVEVCVGAPADDGDASAA